MAGPAKDFFRYIVFVGMFLGVFTQFVACGSEFYQVSLDQDSPQINLRNEPEKSASDPAFGIHAKEGWQRLPIQFRTAADLNADQVQSIRYAMRTWEWALGRKAGEIFAFVGTHTGIVGDSFLDLNSSLRDAFNGHYFDNNWAKTGKKPEVLATTIWENEPSNTQVITKADIRYNSQVYILGDSFKVRSTPERPVVDLESLALHEVGHLLGLEHVADKIDSYSIMNPNLFVGEGLATRTLSQGDIERIQRIYGCVGLSCNIDALLASTMEARAPDNSALVSQVPQSTTIPVQTQRY